MQKCNGNSPRLVLIRLHWNRLNDLTETVNGIHRQNYSQTKTVAKNKWDVVTPTIKSVQNKYLILRAKRERFFHHHHHTNEEMRNNNKNQKQLFHSGDIPNYDCATKELKPWLGIHDNHLNENEIASKWKKSQ